MILGHEAVGEVVEVGSLVRIFKPGDRVIVTAITPDWGSGGTARLCDALRAGCLRVGNFRTSKMACSRSFSM